MDAIIGLHAARAALSNPERLIRKVRGTDSALAELSGLIEGRGLKAEICEKRTLDRLLGGEMVHQGILIEAEPLQPVLLEDVLVQATTAPRFLALVLDRVTDPQNVGAVLRSAAAFGADALIMTRRHAPQATPALLKVASGGYEHVPMVQVGNLGQALERLADAGVGRIGLDEHADSVLSPDHRTARCCLILGAEGEGMRQLTRSHCDHLVRLPTRADFSSLNVANAAAIGLYALSLPTSL